MPLTNELLYLETYSSKGTVNFAKYAIRLFLLSVYGEGTLEELATKYIQEKRDPKPDIQMYFSTIKTRPPQSIRVLLSNLKTFLIENDIELPQKFWKGLSRRVRGNRARTQDRVPSTEELRQILLQMPLHGAALYLTLASSGMRIGECLQLTLYDIKLDENPARIEIPGIITKNGNRRTTFLSSEAKQYIVEWLKNRKTYVEYSNKRSPYPKDLSTEKLFPFGQTNARTIWYVALKKAKLDERDPSTNRYKLHPHVLRKYFRTRLGESIPVDVTEALMGHEGYLTGVYRKYTITDLARIYRKGEGALAVFSNKHQIDQLKGELENKNQQLQQLVTGLSNENLTLKTEIEKQKKEIVGLETNLNYLTEHVKDVESIWLQKVEHAAQGLADKWIEKWKKEFLEDKGAQEGEWKFREEAIQSV